MAFSRFFRWDRSIKKDIFLINKRRSLYVATFALLTNITYEIIFAQKTNIEDLVRKPGMMELFIRI